MISFESHTTYLYVALKKTFDVILDYHIHSNYIEEEDEEDDEAEEEEDPSERVLTLNENIDAI